MKYSLGIDIHSDYIGLVELCLKNDLKISTVIHEPILKTPEQTLHEIFSTHQFKTKKCHLSIPSIKTMKKEAPFNKILTELDILKELATNPSRYFDCAEELLSIDIRHRNEKDNLNYYLIFAVRKSDVDQQIHSLKPYCLKPISVEPDYGALLRLVKYHKKIHAETFIILLPRRILFVSENEILLDKPLNKETTENDTPPFIRHFYMKHPDKKITQIYSLTDESLSLPDIPIEKIQSPVKSELMIAYGLALRGIYGQH